MAMLQTIDNPTLYPGRQRRKLSALIQLAATGIFCVAIQPAFALDPGVVATVNGEPVHQSTVDAVQRQLEGRQQSPDKSQIIDELVNLELLAQLAAKDGLDESEEIKSALELQRLQILANAYMGKLSEDIDLQDDVLRAEYDKQVATLDKPEFNASQILLESEADAAEVIAMLEDGKSFEELAKTRSIDPSGANGGGLGWFQADSVPNSIIEVLGKMAPGDYNKEPVKTDFGWHVLKLEDRRGSPVPDFEAVKPQIRNALVSRELQGKIIELRDAAEIEK